MAVSVLSLPRLSSPDGLSSIVSTPVVCCANLDAASVIPCTPLQAPLTLTIGSSASLITVDTTDAKLQPSFNDFAPSVKGCAIASQVALAFSVTHADCAIFCNGSNCVLSSSINISGALKALAYTNVATSRHRVFTPFE